MDEHGDQLFWSASDLGGHLNCSRLTVLDITVANGVLANSFGKSRSLQEEAISGKSSASTSWAATREMPELLDF